MHLPLPIQAFRAKVRERRLADNWLKSATGVFVPDRYQWRARELCSPGQRRQLAHTLRLIHERAFERRTGCVRPFNLLAVREHRRAVLTLASRLEALDEPVTPAGMLRVRSVLTDGASALYGTVKGPELGDAISSILDLLEPAAGRRVA
jgi:hypothetical protein